MQTYAKNNAKVYQSHHLRAKQRWQALKTLSSSSREFVPVRLQVLKSVNWSDLSVIRWNNSRPWNNFARKRWIVPFSLQQNGETRPARCSGLVKGPWGPDTWCSLSRSSLLVGGWKGRSGRWKWRGASWRFSVTCHVSLIGWQMLWDPKCCELLGWNS